MKNYRVNLEAYKTIFEDLVSQDESELALKLCDLLPAYFRDNIPKEILNLKNELMSKLLTANCYSTAHYDCSIAPSHIESRVNLLGTLRGRLLQSEINNFEDEVQIIEVGAGEFCVPLGAKGNFSYFDISMDVETKKQAYAKIKREVKPIQTIFVANEVIEHLSNPQELRWEMNRYAKGDVKIVHLSTPMYCYDPNHQNWRETQQPHLRAYTPNEFVRVCRDIWPEYNFELYSDGQIMSARGLHKDFQGMVKSIESDKLVVELEDLIKCRQ